MLMGLLNQHLLQPNFVGFDSVRVTVQNSAVLYASVLSVCSLTNNLIFLKPEKKFFVKIKLFSFKIYYLSVNFGSQKSGLNVK